MPNIPTFTTSPGSVPDAPGGQVVDVNFGGGPFAQQAQAGKELSNIADRFAQKYIGAKMEVAAADQTSELSKQIREIEFEAGKIPDRALATQTYDTKTSALLEKWGEQSNNFFVKSNVQAQLAREVALRRHGAQTSAWALEGEAARGKMVEQLDGIIKEAAGINDPRLLEEKLKQGVAVIDGRVAAGMMNAEAGAQHKIQFQSSVYKNIIQTAMARDPAEGVAAFKQYEGKLSAGDQQALRVQAASAEKGVAIDNAASGLIAGAPGTVSSVMAPIIAQFPDLRGRITSADRSAAHNAAVGGASNSQHLHKDTAMDISLAGMDDVTKQKVIDSILANPNVGGFGYYPQTDSIHVDVRTGARTAWGTGGASSAVGKEWPAWMTGKVGEWQKGQSTGDDFAKRQIATLGRIADYVANPANGVDRFAVAARAQSVVSADNAYNTALRKQIQDDQDLALTDLVIRQKALQPGALNALADRWQASGDHSMAARVRDIAAHEEELKNFFTLPPHLQRAYGGSIPGEAGRLIKNELAGLRAAQTDALRQATEEAKVMAEGIAQSNDPRAFRANAETAARIYEAGGRPDLARRVRADFAGHERGFELGKGSPLALEATKKAIEATIQEGGDDLRTKLKLQESFTKAMTKGVEQWNTDAIGAYFNATKITPPELDPNNPLPFIMAMAGHARAAQQMKYQGAPFVPSIQKESFLSPTQVSIWKQGLANGNEQQVVGTVATWFSEMPQDMIAPFAAQLGGEKGNDPFGNSIAQAGWLYNRKAPGDREMADKIVKGALAREKGGPNVKGMVEPGNSLVRADFDSLGNSRQAFPPETRKALDDAAVSLYTATRLGQADASTYDSATMRKAITALNGERFKSRHGDVLLPTGMDANQFYRGVANLTDADVPPFRVGNQMLNANMVKNLGGQFVTVGDGVYKIQFPSPGNGRMEDIPDPRGGPYWKVDIRVLAARPPGSATPSTITGHERTVRERASAPAGIQ